MDGIILIKNGYIREIPKLINVFSKTITCVFWYTAPNDDKNNQKIPKNIRPKIKNIEYLMIKFVLVLVDISYAEIYVFCSFTSLKFLSDKNINLIIIIKTCEAAKEIHIWGIK